jgi:hypothetical protein
MVLSCSKEGEENEINHNIQNPENSFLPLAGGVVYMDPIEYNQLPVLDLNEVESINGEEILENRASREVLDTPPVSNQGGEGSCTAFASSYVVSSYYLHVIAGLPYTNSQAIRSPEYVYNSTKIAGSCEKAGAYLNQVLNFIRDKGVCSWTQMPYSDANGCSVKPNSTQLLQGELGKITSWSAVAKNIETIKDLIRKGYPTVMAFDANDNFKNQTFNSPYIYKTYKADNKASGHAVSIIGFDDNKQYLIVQNSWGKGYQDKGLFYISYALFPSIAKELYIMKPSNLKKINVRNTSACGEVTINLNNVNYRIAKGQTLTLPAKLEGNSLYIWECIGGNSNCKWDGDYAPVQAKNYKIIDVNQKWDLKLVAD